MALQRLAKFLAGAGVASRRKCEEIIAAGRVRVNKEIVKNLATCIDPLQDEVSLDEKIVQATGEKIYLMLYKPAGFITTTTDPFGRKTVMELLPPLPVKVYPVGRLDLDTEGLLFFTNDGDFALAVTHPRHEFDKLYEGIVQGVPGRENLKELMRGVELDGKPTSAAKIEILGTKNGNANFSMKIHEGRKRQIRRMWESVGHPVLYLKRVAIGQVRLGDLPLGRYRYLTGEEVGSILGRKTTE